MGFSLLHKYSENLLFFIGFVKDMLYEHPNTALPTYYGKYAVFTHFFGSEYELTTGEGYE